MPRGNPNLAAGPGRPKGSLNKTTREIKDAARALLEGPEYVRNRLKRLEEGKLPPAVECLLYHYAYGKPRETLAVEGTESLAELLQTALSSEHGDGNG